MAAVIPDFDPLDFRRTAIALASDPAPTEAMLRTAISRFYYAAFLVSRRVAQMDSERKGVHEKLQKYWKTRDSRQAQRLINLFTYRCRADYDRDCQINALQCSESHRLADQALRFHGAPV